MRCVRIGNSSIEFAGAVFRGEEVLVTCELLYVFAGPESKRPQTVPESLRHLLQAYEAGEPVVSVRQGGWDELDHDALDVRTEVFVDERKIPLELERDGQDDDAFHVVIFNGLGQSIATGRLLRAANGQARVGRLAVRRVLRGIGLGPRVLRALQAEAKRRGDTELVLNSQCANRGFYEALGFAGRGLIFDKGGVPTIEMCLAL
jgi:predicted GNAT family N-acyltransferase